MALMTSRTHLFSKQQKIYAMRIWPLSTGNLRNLNSFITNKANLTNPTVHLTQTPQYTIENWNVHISLLHGVLWICGK